MDDLVQSVVCYNRRPLIFHGYLGPFFILQAAIYYTFIHSTSTSTSSSDVEHILPKADDNQLEDEHARRHTYELWVIFAIISIGAQIVTFLFCHWSVHVKCWLSYTICHDPFKSRYVKVVPTPNNGSTELVELKRETINKEARLSFTFQKTKYFYDEITGSFNAIQFPCNLKLSHYKQWKGYETAEELHLNDRLYGHNELEMVIPEFKELFIERATAPFFVFQMFCVGLWCLDDFVLYTLFTLFMLVTFEVVLVKHQMRNMQEIRRMGNQPYQIQVYRQNKWKSVRSDQLVSGDLVSIVRSDNNIPCDILLVRGSCIIDESTLTGESVPQMKEPIDDIDDDERLLDINQDKLHIIYGGTKVLQHTTSSKSDPGCIGYVLNTGFNTSQGKLLRTILFGVKRVTANNFETFCFIMFLLVFAIISAWYVWTKGIEDPKKSRYRLFFECTMIITSVIPPELPIELSLAVNSSLLSLVRLYIYCTEPFRIPFAGKVEYCCFDKTGTLTSDDLVIEGVAGLIEAQTSDQENQSGDTSLETSSPKSKQQAISQTAKQHKKTINTIFADHPMITPVDKCPVYTQQILASCHSLAYLDEKLVGDPLERKILEAINWNYSKNGTVVPKKGRAQPLKIQQRFHFNSTLKRMSVISSLRMDLTNENVYICTTKGAPEYLKPLFKHLPDNYDEVYLEMSRLGARVLALGYKTLGSLSNKDLNDLKREKVEKDLMFAGFIIISCPLKPDSAEVSAELAASGHRLVMITGDGALTACHVASILNFTKKTVLVLTKKLDDEDNPKESKWMWKSTDDTISVDFNDEKSHDIIILARKYDLCLTGDSLSYVMQQKDSKLVYDLISRVKVFARVSPKQKESIITTLKSRGKTILMCGDGTNDVGALKHAQVGVALLSSSSSGSSSKQVQEQQQANKPPSPYAAIEASLAQARAIQSQRPLTPDEKRRVKILETQMKLKQMLEEQEAPSFVRLGDASIAAPFTSRLSSTRCISHIIKQGRCTLVTTLQMFKILALNALLSAYCHSVLYLDGIKFSDAQFTLQGFLNTLCFLFITRSQPLNQLSKQRPLPNIFNLYTILTVTLQFAVHFSALIFLFDQSKKFQAILDLENNSTISAIESSLEANNSSLTLNSTIPGLNDTQTTNSTADAESDGFHTEFKPSLVNSTIYVIWLSVQIATFVVNYKGHPFMQSLRNNRPLCYSFIGPMLIVFCCVNGWMEGLSEQLSIVEFPLQLKPIVLGTIIGTFVLTFAIDRICESLFDYDGVCGFKTHPIRQNLIRKNKKSL